jgi:hypothetical protein
MFRKSFLAFAIVGVLSAFALCANSLKAAPILSVVAGGIQGNNYVWDIGIAPDFLLNPAGTPLAVELGFRLTGSPLASVTNINPSQWDTPNPGQVIFGWETLTDLDPGPGVNLKPVGLQSNTVTSEVFAAYGSEDFTTPGVKPFLRITAKGPNNGGSATSTIQWLGSYVMQGRIAQSTGPISAQNFDIYSGILTQVPEPMSASLFAIGAFAVAAGMPRRSRRA